MFCNSSMLHPLIRPLLIIVTLLVLVNANITISGISSGAAFAIQFHVAYSSYVTGAGIVAGLPYYCAGGDVEIALKCMSSPDSIDLKALYDATAYAYSLDTIDDPSQLANSKVYLYSGTNDTIVSPGSMEKVVSYYLNYMNEYSMKTVFNIGSEHSFVTQSFGSSCAYLGSPFINNCHYDQAGDILNFLYGTLNGSVAPISSNIVTLSQAKFVPIVGLDEAGLADDAYLYVPSGCSSNGSCRIHVAFHGCEQTLTDINTTFVEKAGYNGWAESNNIVILYPQAKKTDLNPKGCWDWWGYTGEDYASKLGVQMVTVKSMADHATKTFSSSS